MSWSTGSSSWTAVARACGKSQSMQTKTCRAGEVHGATLARPRSPKRGEPLGAPHCWISSNRAVQQRRVLGLPSRWTREALLDVEELCAKASAPSMRSRDEACWLTVRLELPLSTVVVRRPREWLMGAHAVSVGLRQHRSFLGTECLLRVLCCGQSTPWLQEHAQLSLHPALLRALRRPQSFA